MNSFANGIFVHCIFIWSFDISLLYLFEKQKKTQKNRKNIITIHDWFLNALRKHNFSSPFAIEILYFFPLPTNTHTHNKNNQIHYANATNATIDHHPNELSTRQRNCRSHTRTHKIIHKQSLKDRRHRCPIWIIFLRNPAARQILRTQHHQRLLLIW